MADFSLNARKALWVTRILKPRKRTTLVLAVWKELEESAEYPIAVEESNVQKSSRTVLSASITIILYYTEEQT